MSEINSRKILFICRHNTVRSQIASTLANKLGKGKVTAWSAGPEPLKVPDYIKNWARILTGEKQTVKSTALSEVTDLGFDLVITLCDKSHTALPTLPSDTQHICWDFHHSEDISSVKHLEMEIAERLRLMFLAKHII